MGINSDLKGLIAAAAKKNGVSAELLERLIDAESAGNPNAVSPKGAQGLGQLMPETGKWLAKGGAYDPFNPNQNLDLSAGYLASLKKQFGGDDRAALAAYNWGPGNVKKALADGKLEDSEMPGETQNYLKKLLTDQAKGQATGAAKEAAMSNIGNMGSGAAAGEQLYGGLQASEPVATALDGGTILADGTMAGQGLTGGIGIGGLAAGAYTGYQQATGVADFASGKSLSTPQKLALALPTFGASLFSDQLQDAFMGGKDKDQQARDGVRGALQQMGVLDDKYQVKLAKGGTYDMGKDGGFMLPNLDGGARHAYDADFSNPLTHQTVGWANPLALIITGGDKKAASDLAGQLANAATSDAKDLEGARANMNAIFTQMNIDNDKAGMILRQMKDQGRINENEFNAALYGLGTMKSGSYNPNEREIFAGKQNNLASVQGVPDKPTSTPNPSGPQPIGRVPGTPEWLGQLGTKEPTIWNGKPIVNYPGAIPGTLPSIYQPQHTNVVKGTPENQGLLDELKRGYASKTQYAGTK
jgi:hypothetical protein